jgi:tetratricopeptide (TPR) repeat protein
MAHDVFVSHASEDKARFVDALVGALQALGLTCWYDKCEIRLGDDFRKKMDEGLANARHGVVVLSPSYFKYWPEAELSALFNQERVFEQKRILPVRLDLDHATLTTRSPLLAARAALGWEQGVEVLAKAIRDAILADTAPTPGRRSPVHNLPARRAGQLFGRERDLEQVLEMLAPGQRVRLAASIEGLAGVGKTELALHVVERLARTDRFPGGIFWFDAENPDLTATWGGAIADELAVGLGPIAERAAGALRAVSTGAPVLLVLDNVERWTRESEPHPLPGGPNVALLVTTRFRFLAGTSFLHHPLEVLNPEASRALLASVSGRDLAATEGTDELLEQLEGHSLAVELAGAYLREFPRVSPGRYLDELRAGKVLEDKVTELVRYERTVHQALDANKRHIDEAAQRALRVAACFAPEEASIALLEACGVGGEELRILRRFHLIGGDGDRWRMHRLVRHWATRGAAPGETAAARRAFVRGCVAHAEQITLEEGFRIQRADGPHLEHAVSLAESVLPDEPGKVSRLLERVGTALASAGDLTRGRELLEQALALALRNFGEQHPSVAIRRSHLALVLRALGDLPRAKELLELALASSLRGFGEHDPSVATIRSHLALVLQALGDLPRAKELLELALASDLKNLGKDHPSVAAPLTNLALVLTDLGELPRAMELSELALALRLKNLGEDHWLVAKTRSCLASVLHHLGDLDRAKDLLELALASALANFMEDNPSVATIRSNLALVLLDLGELRRAKELLELALASGLRNLGEDHPSVATCRANLGGVLLDLGESPRARELLELALASELRKFGEDHPTVGRSRSSLALVLQDLGDLTRAKELLELALASDLKSFGEDHALAATDRANLGGILWNLGESPQARELLESALSSLVRNRGEDHPNVAACRANLAMVLRDLWELPRARELLELALASELRRFGEDHPTVGRSRSSLALVLQDLGDLSRAKELLELALTTALRSLGEASPTAATYRSSLAGVFQDLGDFHRAKELQELALTTEECSLGPDHPSTSYTRARLASVLADLGESNEARTQALRAVRAVANQPEGSRYRRLVEQLAEKILTPTRAPG